MGVNLQELWGLTQHYLDGRFTTIYDITGCLINNNKLQFTVYSGLAFPWDKKPYLTAVYFKRLNSIPKTLIQSIDFPNAINWNNPKLLLDYWISDFKCSYNNISKCRNNM